jgi:hypothetical protein
MPLAATWENIIPIDLMKHQIQRHDLKGKNNHHRGMQKKCNIDRKLKPAKQHVVTS